MVKAMDEAIGDAAIGDEVDVQSDDDKQSNESGMGGRATTSDAERWAMGVAAVGEATRHESGKATTGEVTGDRFVVNPNLTGVEPAAVCD